MTTIIKSERFRNNRDDATILVEQYINSSCTEPLWRYSVKRDHSPMLFLLSDSLLNKPNKARLQARI